MKVGHHYNSRHASELRVFAPERKRVSLVVLPDCHGVDLAPDALGYWQVEVPRLPAGTRYWIEIDGKRYPDLASRCQPDGVHGASMIAAPVPVERSGWQGVRIEDAILYELHLGTFTSEGTLAAATARLQHLSELGITVVELLPVAAFPGKCNWGYDGTYPFALHVDYGDYVDLKVFIERAHRVGIAVLLDVVYNHFGPEGNYSAAYAPYCRDASTPWGAAINFDEAYSHGVREFFLENVRYWLQDVGFDGFRMDAVSLVFDTMPFHILREFTDLARAIGQQEGREVLMIAEHLRNDRQVTSADGFHFTAQWSDDLNHALFARLTGEDGRHLVNFGSFADVVKALDRGFVLDGTRLDRYRHLLTGTDGALTQATEHVAYIQNHDQIGNRVRGDRLIATHGREKALLAVTALMASAFVPMLFMGEEFGATSPFFFFEDFADPDLVASVRRGRKRDVQLDGDSEPPDPHSPATFLASKLQWSDLENPQCRSVFAYYKRLIAMKRSGALGPRDRSLVRIAGDETRQLIRVETPHTVTLLNFSDEFVPVGVETVALEPVLLSVPLDRDGERLSPFAAAIYLRLSGS